MCCCYGNDNDDSIGDEVVDDDKSFDNLNIVDSLHKYN